jgi:hypothetical protein
MFSPDIPGAVLFLNPGDWSRASTRSTVDRLDEGRKIIELYGADAVKMVMTGRSFSLAEWLGESAKPLRGQITVHDREAVASDLQAVHEAFRLSWYLYVATMSRDEEARSRLSSLLASQLEPPPPSDETGA